MELVQDLILSQGVNIYMLILSYFGNKMEIPLLFLKDQKEMIEKMKEKFFLKP